MEPEEIVDGDPERTFIELYLFSSIGLIEAGCAVKLVLDVKYPDAYPDVLPELSINVLEGELDDDETSHLMKELQTVVRAT